MTRQFSLRKIRYLKNILLGIIGLAASLSIYIIFIIYPSFSRLLIQYTKNDAVRAARYVSETLPNRSGAATSTTMDEPLIQQLQLIERSLELIKLKIYTASGETIYSTDFSEIGVINQSDYFKNITAAGTNKAQIIKRNAYSLEGVKVKTDVVEVYVPLASNSKHFNGAVEIYYDISKRKQLMDQLIIHSTVVLTALIGGLIIVVFLLFVRESNVIQERQIAQRQIRENRKKLQTILDAIPDMILLVDQSRQPLWANQQARNFRNEESATDNNESPLGRLGKNWLPQGFSSCFKEGIACEEEMELIHYNGQVISFSCTATKVKFKAAKDIAPSHLVLLIYRDITEKKVLQAETLRAGQLASIGELAAGVAHEINNPINGIINCSQLLLDNSTLPETTHGIARRIFKAGDRIAIIVRSLLSFARVESDLPVATKIGRLIDDTLELTAAQIKKDQIIFDINIEENLPMLNIHPQQIQQVLLNIISNSRYAIKKQISKEPGIGKISLKTKTVQQEGKVWLEIIFTDNGTGIPEKLLERVCNPFFTTKPAGEGTGLGLSISQSIMENHGGYLKISNAIESGVLVQLDFPLS